LNLPVLAVLRGPTADKKKVSDQLNAALKSELAASATSSGQLVLTNLLRTLPMLF
jgi:hypothetical protein